MRIAIVGAGVSGLVAARLLSRDHEITVFEADDRPGGHAHTVDIAGAGELGRPLAVDCGFLVYNEITYPRFTRLLAALGVATRPAPMSFSVRDEASGLEYCGTSLATLFAQPSNLFRPRFLAMLRDIVRFNREAPRWSEAHDAARPLAQLLADGGYGRAFREHYLLPMAAAVWSSTPEAALAMPARFLVGFFANHGFLTVDGHFPWRTIAGGSRSYVEAIAAPLGGRLRLGTPVAAVRRAGEGVEITTGRGVETFDEAVLALHADQALAVLADATASERAVLGAIRYQTSEALLHTDDSLLPRARRARASWNYHVPAPAAAGARRLDGPRVTYDLTRLQSLPTDRRYLLTLNGEERVDPRLVLARFAFAHPLFTPAAVAAQARHAEVSGADRVHFCGAYWGNGFHEDGVASAWRVAATLGVAGEGESVEPVESDAEATERVA